MTLSYGKEKQVSVWVWCPGALTKSSTPKCACPSKLEKSRREFPGRGHTLQQPSGKEKNQLDVSPAVNISALQEISWTNTQRKYNTWLIYNDAHKKPTGLKIKEALNHILLCCTLV